MGPVSPRQGFSACRALRLYGLDDDLTLVEAGPSIGESSISTASSFRHFDGEKLAVFVMIPFPTGDLQGHRVRVVSDETSRKVGTLEIKDRAKGESRWRKTIPDPQLITSCFSESCAIIKI
jgi:hypothetical protein